MLSMHLSNFPRDPIRLEGEAIFGDYSGHRSESMASFIFEVPRSSNRWVVGYSLQKVALVHKNIAIPRLFFGLSKLQLMHK